MYDRCFGFSTGAAGLEPLHRAASAEPSATEQSAAICQPRLRRPHGAAARQAESDLGVERAWRHRARANGRAYRHGNSRSGWQVDGEDRSARGWRALHDSDLWQADRRTAGRAGGRRVDLRRPIEYAVWFGAGEERRRRSEKRELPADPFLERRRAG